MKLKDLLLFLVIFNFFYLAGATQLPHKIITISGTVLCEGKGVANVAVTDGVSTVVTDKKGMYSLSITSDREYMYYSLPSGYNSPIVDGVPVFYKAVDPGKAKQKIDFEIHKAEKSQFTHSFIAWADPQVLDFEDFEKLKTVVEDVNQTVRDLPEPTHAIALGDIVFDRLNHFDEYKKTIAKTGLPFYQLVGNHDMDYNNRSNELSSATYSKNFGPAHYSFNIGNVHYVVLKDVFYYGHSYHYMGYIDETQLQWLEQDLAGIKPGSTVVVALHIPTVSKKPSNNPPLTGSVLNKDALFKILAPYNTHILAGHSHTQWNTIISPTIMEHVHAAASGAWWQGEICTDGSPKGYTVYAVNGDSISWYFKGVGHSKEEQFKIYGLGTDENYPDCIVANVYNYDPEWSVLWYENDKLVGAMEQYWGKDPEAKEKYQPGKNKKHAWLNSSETNHLFRAPVKNQQAKITVVVNDRFGNQYKKDDFPANELKGENHRKLVWSDEFSYTGLPDSTKWNYATDRNDTGWGNNELQWYTEANSNNAYVSNGVLKITAIKEPISGKNYSSARLTTRGKGEWKYGKVEARAKLPTGRGTWPAIWMMPVESNYGGWPKSGEIDIMEHVGYDPDTVHSTIHTEYFNHIIGTQVGKKLGVPTATTDFHVYSMEWEKDEIRSYVDGVHYFTFKNNGKGYGAWPFDQPFHLILNLAIGGGWGGIKGVDDTLFPHIYEIDYVRVYR